MRLRGTQRERMSFMCMGSVWEVHSRNMYGFCMWDQFIDWSHTHKQQEHVWFMCVGSVCLRDLYTAGMCMVYVCGLWDQFIWEVHSKNVCGISSYEYTAGTFDDVWFMCVGSVCMRSTQQERVWFMCVGSVCMRSTQQERVWFMCVGSVCMRSTQQERVWFMCVGSVCMRSTQQERVWFMCVGSVCMRSTQQGHAQYGLYVLDQSVWEVHSRNMCGLCAGHGVHVLRADQFLPEPPSLRAVPWRQPAAWLHAVTGWPQRRLRPLQTGLQQWIKFWLCPLWGYCQQPFQR